MDFDCPSERFSRLLDSRNGTFNSVNLTDGEGPVSQARPR